MIRSIFAGSGTGETTLSAAGEDGMVFMSPVKVPTGPGRPPAPAPGPPEHVPPDPAPPPRPDPTDPEPDPPVPDIPVIDPPHEPAIPEPKMRR